MKKTLIILGAIAAVLLMVSTATAVPTTQSSTTMDYIEKPKINFDIQQISQNNIKTLGFLEWLLQILTSILNWYEENEIGSFLEEWEQKLEAFLEWISPIRIFVDAILVLVNSFQALFQIISNLFGNNNSDPEPEL